MERIAFMLRALPGRRDEADEKLCALGGEIKAMAAAQGIENLSFWGAEDQIFGYGEFPDGFSETPEALAARGRWAAQLKDCLRLVCAPGEMRLMYHDYGVVREDKSLIRHRVFCTRLKPGCAEEYKRRHDGLIAARGDRVSQGPDSNFTIWHGDGYIFGYCEKVKSFDHEMTETERQDTIQWETRQLEIMDWLTDDVDWITGEKHDPIRRIL